MPLLAKLVSSSAFTNGDSFAIVEGNHKPIRVKLIVRGDKTNLVVFTDKARPGLEYSGEICLPDHRVLCVEGSFCDTDKFLSAKTRVLQQICTFEPPQPLRVTGPVADYVSRVGNSHSVAIGNKTHEIKIWHLEPTEGALSRFWFACETGIWRAEAHLGTRQGTACLATL